jgi:DNA adenine methylase
MAVALGLLPERALLSDINPHLINFYRWLQQGKGLHVEIEMVSHEGKFYDARTRFNALLSNKQGDTKEAAELFYYLNRSCFNGLCRFNNKGEFNVPFGRYKNPNYVKDFSAYARVLTSWTFNVGPYDSLGDESLGDERLRPGDFIYADPPYDVEFTKYSKEDFTSEDQKKLASWLLKHEGPVVVSNQATEKMRGIYNNGEFDYVELEAPRRISCNGDRRPAMELIAARNLGGIKLKDVLEKLGHLE